MYYNVEWLHVERKRERERGGEKTSGQGERVIKVNRREESKKRQNERINE